MVSGIRGPPAQEKAVLEVAVRSVGVLSGCVYCRGLKNHILVPFPSTAIAS